jgi:hypothetical protein
MNQNQYPNQAYAPHPPAAHAVPFSQPVVVTDVRMKFFSMMLFMIKWALASIPAVIILSAIFGGLGVLFFLIVSATGIAANH